MGKVSYKMSREMYNTIKYPMVWNWKLQKMVKKGKPLTEKEILDALHTLQEVCMENYRNCTKCLLRNANTHTRKMSTGWT